LFFRLISSAPESAAAYNLAVETVRRGRGDGQEKERNGKNCEAATLGGKGCGIDSTIPLISSSVSKALYARRSSAPSSREIKSFCPTRRNAKKKEEKKNKKERKKKKRELAIEERAGGRWMGRKNSAAAR